MVHSKVFFSNVCKGSRKKSSSTNLLRPYPLRAKLPLELFSLQKVSKKTLFSLMARPLPLFLLIAWPLVQKLFFAASLSRCMFRVPFDILWIRYLVDRKLIFFLKCLCLIQTYLLFPYPPLFPPPYQ